MLSRSAAWWILLIAAPLPAQANGCAPYGATGSPGHNVCQAALDGAAVFIPVAGILTTAGNPMPGSVDGVGRIGIDLRVNATTVVLPDLRYNGIGTTVAARQSVVAPAPLIEGAIEVWPGFGRRFLAADLLGSAQLLPTHVINDLHIDVNARSIGSVALGLGIGARVTVFGARGALPGVTVSAMHRTLPRIGVGDVALGDEYAFAANLASNEYRLVLGENLGFVLVGAGAGWTHYHSDGDVVYRDPTFGDVDPDVPFTVDDSRAVEFADVGAYLGPLFLLGELGVQQGKSLDLATTFAGNDPAARRVFGSVGLRLGF